MVAHVQKTFVFVKNFYSINLYSINFSKMCQAKIM